MKQIQGTRGEKKRAAQGEIKGMNNRTENLAVVRNRKFIETPICILCQVHQSRINGWWDSSRLGDWSASLWFRRCAQMCCLWHKQSPFWCLLFPSSQQDGQSNESPYSQSPSPKQSQKQSLFAGTPSTGMKTKKSFLPSMTEKTPSQNLALDRQSHSGICSPHLKWYLLFSRGREGSKVIAKYRFFHALSKRTHTTFFLYTIYYRYFFYHSQGCSYDLRNKLVTKAHPLKTCTFKGRYHLLERHWCNWVASKNMAEVDLPRGLGFLNIFERKKKD